MNHATAAATLNRYSQHREISFHHQQQQQLQQQQQQPQQLRYSFGNEYIFGDTHLGGSSGFEPMLSSTTIHNPNTLDGIIGPSAAATFIHGKTLKFFLMLVLLGLTNCFSRIFLFSFFFLILFYYSINI